ncbi:phage antirepressor KilAC domain-containing protein [Rhodococcus aetherivorans]|uniref:phage antirepressor KilAC domain-containing protein n=1 Tax=Rhodococcus aetherivorans TaxID=191292 RepID=UPI0031D164C6
MQGHDTKGISMSDLTLPGTSPSGQSPFDSIRQVRADGTEFWSARDLMPLMGYARWENFATPIERAMKTAENQGMDVSDLFLRSQEKTSGRPRVDFELARYAAYLVAMNGDPNIKNVADAQHYFAIQTRVAETAPAPFALPQTMGEALRLAADQFDRAELEASMRRQLEAKVEHDAPMLAKAEAHTASTKAIHRQEFAREVQAWGQKIHGIRILQKHVFAFLAHKGMTIGGNRSDAGHATAHAVRSGWAWTDKGVSEDGYEYATTKLLPKGQDVAWKWITAHVEVNGTLELPRQIHGGAA